MPRLNTFEYRRVPAKSAKFGDVETWNGKGVLRRWMAITCNETSLYTSDHVPQTSGIHWIVVLPIAIISHSHKQLPTTGKNIQVVSEAIPLQIGLSQK